MVGELVEPFQEQLSTQTKLVKWHATTCAEPVEVEVDLDYQGIINDYPTAKIAIPFKKPHKSRANPHTCLSDSQRQQNRLLSSTQVIVEHAVAGLKHFSMVGECFDKLNNHLSNHCYSQFS